MSKTEWKVSPSGNVLSSNNGTTVRVAPRERQWVATVRRGDKTSILGVYLHEEDAIAASEKYLENHMRK